jgi:signal peptidase I
MRPTFAPGDAVVTELVPARSLRVGQVAVITPPGQSSPFAHRLVSVRHTAAGIAVTTRGDANPQPDAWHVVISQPQVAVVVAHVPKLGYLLNAVHDPRWRSELLALLGLFTTFLATRTVLAASPKQPRVAPTARP